MEKQNRAMRQKRKKEETTRLRTLIGKAVTLKNKFSTTCLWYFESLFHGENTKWTTDLIKLENSDRFETTNDIGFDSPAAFVNYELLHTRIEQSLRRNVTLSLSLSVSRQLLYLRSSPKEVS